MPKCKVDLPEKVWEQPCLVGLKAGAQAGHGALRTSSPHSSWSCPTIPTRAPPHPSFLPLPHGSSISSVIRAKGSPRALLLQVQQSFLAPRIQAVPLPPPPPQGCVTPLFETLPWVPSPSVPRGLDGLWAVDQKACDLS